MFQVVAEDRGVLSLSGEDRRSFLQGLISNDIEKVTEDRAVFSAFLTAQGKFLHDFFIAEVDGRFLIDCERARRDDLFKRLRRYRLRSKVELVDETERWTVVLVAGDGAQAALKLTGASGDARAFAGGTAFVDPRLPDLGARLILPSKTAEKTLQELQIPRGSSRDYDLLRLGLGVPDGSRDLPVEKAFLMESGFDELHGIDWSKGCYVGQELTARTKYRGLVRRRLVPVEIEGPIPEFGAPLYLGDKAVGEMRSAKESLGLAMVRLEAFEDGKEVVLSAGEARLRPRRPDWATF